MKCLTRFLLVCLALGYGGIAFAQAVATEIRGAAFYQLGTAPEQPLVAGQKVPPGALLRTASDSMVVLGFPDRQVCVIGESSTFRIVDYRFDSTQPEKGQVSLNLINGSLRIVLGEIGTLNPGAIKVQIGVATLAMLPSGESNRTDASAVVLGGPVALTVLDGRAVLVPSTGKPQQLDAGQGLYLGSDGSVRQGNAAQFSSLFGQVADGKEILKQLASLQGMTDTVQQTVIAMASLLPTADIVAAPVLGTTVTAGTAGTGGGGNIASPN